MVRPFRPLGFGVVVLSYKCVSREVWHCLLCLFISVGLGLGKIPTQHGRGGIAQARWKEQTRCQTISQANPAFLAGGSH
jgi:hypothetical protein